MLDIGSEHLCVSRQTTNVSPLSHTKSCPANAPVGCNFVIQEHASPHRVNQRPRLAYCPDVTRVMAKHRIRITKPVIFSKRFFRNSKNNSCPKTSLPRIRVHSRCHKGSFAFLTTKHFGRLHHYESSESGTRIFQFQIQQIPRQSGNEHTDWEKIICVEQ